MTAIEVDSTGDVWLGLFGGGLARLSGGRFDHWHQLNSGLVNDVVYGVAVENDNVWAATTAGASRYNTKTGEWSIYTEKNAPMEEIWNYGVSYDDGKVYIGVWGSGVLEFDVKRERWKDYLDPDGEMEIDLYRDDGIVHVITTGVSYVDGVAVGLDLLRRLPLRRPALAGLLRPRRRPAQRLQQLRSRAAAPNEAWYCHRQGPRRRGRFRPGDTWVTYTRDAERRAGSGEGHEGRRGGGGGGHADRAHPQLRDLGRRRRGRHLGRHLQGALLGHRRGLLPGPEGGLRLTTPD